MTLNEMSTGLRHVVDQCWRQRGQLLVEVAVREREREREGAASRRTNETAAKPAASAAAAAAVVVAGVVSVDDARQIGESDMVMIVHTSGGVDRLDKLLLNKTINSNRSGSSSSSDGSSNSSSDDISRGNT